MIHDFFAVTRTSVYRVTDQKDENHTPIVEKIALRGTSAVSVGERLKDGGLVGITRWGGIILYDEDHYSKSRKRPLRPEEVNIVFWGGHTSPVVALFLKEDEAMNCFNSENLQDRDQRWREQTEEVLTAIGDSHPVFILSRMDPLSF